MYKKLLKILIIVMLLILGISYYSCKNDQVNTNTPNSDPISYDLFPCWSPVNNLIAYSGGGDRNSPGTFIINTDGTNKIKISSLYGKNGSWSPDGQWIVFESRGDIYKRKIFDDTITIRLTTSGHNFSPSWSKDGLWIAYDSNDDSPTGGNFIWKMKADNGSQKKRIFFTPTVGAAREPDWFPDSKRLIIMWYVRETGEPEIAIIDTLGNSEAILTNNTLFEHNPKVSPDGNYILFGRDSNNGQIYIVNLDGTNEILINNQYSLYPNWSPDGTMITYTNCSPDDGRIWIMSKNGSSKRKISY